jgi:hypothetical protein
VVPQIVGYVVAGGLMFVWDVYKSSRKDKPPPEPPLLFSAPQVEIFTHVSDAQGQKAREFDADAAATIRADLELRRAIPQELPAPIASTATAFRVVPLTDATASAPRAIDVVKEAHSVGATVLGSLSLVLLMSGEPHPFILLVGGPDVRGLAPVKDARGMPPSMAILPPEPAPVAARVEPPAGVPTTAPVPAEELEPEPPPPAEAPPFPPPSAAQNGAHKPPAGLGALASAAAPKDKEA